jgi:hypothetical protein
MANELLKYDENARGVTAAVTDDASTDIVQLRVDPVTKRLKVDAIISDADDALVDTPESFEDSSFVTGDSPATLDVNAALGRNATQGYIICDGAGDIRVAFSTDGVSFGDNITLKESERLNFSNQSVDTIRITWVSDSAYRVAVI